MGGQVECVPEEHVRRYSVWLGELIWGCVCVWAHARMRTGKYHALTVIHGVEGLPFLQYGLLLLQLIQLMITSMVRKEDGGDEVFLLAQHVSGPSSTWLPSFSPPFPGQRSYSLPLLFYTSSKKPSLMAPQVPMCPKYSQEPVRSGKKSCGVFCLFCL